MITIAGFMDDYYEIFKKDPRKVIVYGVGNGYRQRKDMIPHIDMLCDKNAVEIGSVDGLKVSAPEKIKDFAEPVYVIVTVMPGKVFRDICTDLIKYCVDATVFHLYNNISFDYSFYSSAVSYYSKTDDKPLRVNIACFEPSWIYRKFAERMEENLKALGVDVAISPDTRCDVDINHHISFSTYKAYPNDTLMISHVNCNKLFEITKRKLETAAVGVCMSKETLDQLVIRGIPANRLCYINPAHDGVIKPKKYVIGITHRCYDEQDVRKRNTSIIEMLDGVDPMYFKFVIMGSGWDDIVKILENKGFETDYYHDFEYATYTRIIPQMDYFVYEGYDEGSMGYLDAVAAGVGTIVTPQGFHLDNGYPIDYPCRTIGEFNNAFLDLQNKRKARIESVESWTWRNYAYKHLVLWNYILRKKPLKELFKDQLCYQDGIYSLFIEDDRIKGE